MQAGSEQFETPEILYAELGHDEPMIQRAQGTRRHLAPAESSPIPPRARKPSLSPAPQCTKPKPSAVNPPCTLFVYLSPACRKFDSCACCTRKTPSAFFFSPALPPSPLNPATGQRQPRVRMASGARAELAAVPKAALEGLSAREKPAHPQRATVVARRVAATAAIPERLARQEPMLALLALRRVTAHALGRRQSAN